ncbi:MAG: hypothetical protein KYX69_13555 [Sphingomonas sp.]|uniref:hypothetical protein n=1 Tax=Sphingomonas sp. TaxID=28214 RepID=UPI0026246E4B|nr:hypothetical protein [Sphingomonas sp.]MDK2768731.1 hypothetical protein [Sphingomonas sp.]
MVKLVLGAEHDLALTNTLLDVLRELGAEEVFRNWGVAGSQEINTLQYKLDGTPLTVEAETYIGLSLSGDELAIQSIVDRVRDRKRG